MLIATKADIAHTHSIVMGGSASVQTIICAKGSDGKEGEHYNTSTSAYPIGRYRHTAHCTCNPFPLDGFAIYVCEGGIQL